MAVDAARYLLVKGACDLVADQNGIIDSISEPTIEALEAIGGTGDIITGLQSALIGVGKPIPEACISAARISRLAGEAANPNPGTQVSEIIRHIPDILDR